MDTETIQGILAKQKPGRVLFPYYKDYYAIYILKQFVGNGKTVRELKQSPFANFLHKPIVRDVLATCSDGVVTPEQLDTAWSLVDWDAIETYRLSLGHWGSSKGTWKWNQAYYQTSRPGGNVVVQLNFGNKHNNPYKRLIRPRGLHPFTNGCHPIADEEQELTLAWCRVDADLEVGEALIEEVQNDWIREADDEWTWTQQSRVSTQETQNITHREKALERYVKQILKPHRKLWAEAVLAATLQFLLEDLNIRTVYYHTYEGGQRLKGMGYGQPPRSLYSALPKRLGFRKTDKVPLFLQQERRLRKTLAKGPLTMFSLNL